jgi:hypothetical protein
MAGGELKVESQKLRVKDKSGAVGSLPLPNTLRGGGLIRESGKRCVAPAVLDVLIRTQRLRAGLIYAAPMAQRRNRRHEERTGPQDGTHNS